MGPSPLTAFYCFRRSCNLGRLQQPCLPHSFAARTHLSGFNVCMILVPRSQHAENSSWPMGRLPTGDALIQNTHESNLFRIH